MPSRFRVRVRRARRRARLWMGDGDAISFRPDGRTVHLLRFSALFDEPLRVASETSPYAEMILSPLDLDTVKQHALAISRILANAVSRDVALSEASGGREVFTSRSEPSTS